MSLADIDDRLLDRVMAGDQGAFRVLVENCDRLVTALLVDRVGHREEIADLRQEVFFRTYRGLERLRDRRKFASWLRGICRNVVREFWAAKARDHGVLEEVIEPEAPPSVDETEVSIEEAVKKGMEVLPVRYREVLRLRYFGKLSYEEIADTLGLSFMAVDALMRRAKGRLKETMAPILEREDLR